MTDLNKKKKNRWITAFLILVMAVGAGFLVYPTFSNWWNSFRQSRAITQYVEKVAGMDSTEHERILREAEEYNQKLFRFHNGIYLSDTEREEYERILDVTGTGIMGYVEIPSIGVNLPIYHGTNESVLQIAIGHLEGTSLPVGGENTHTVISGHRGLPSARLFTDIDTLKEGDRFLIHVLNRTLAYEVDQILVVLPEETKELGIIPGEDHCTLLTCTPYGINTHRLLVRGARTEYSEDAPKSVKTEAGPDALMIDTAVKVPVIAGLALVILLFLILLLKKPRRK